MSSSHPSEQSQLHDLSQAMAANRLPQAVTLAFALAGRGALPIIELFGLAGLMNQAGAGAQAVELYQLWLRRTDNALLFAAWYNLGVLQLQNNDLDGAEHALQQALQLKDDFVEARISLGSLHERRPRLELALATWRQALKQLSPASEANRPLRIQVLNNLGRVYQLRHQTAEAEDALMRSLLLDPGQSGVITHWVRLRQQLCAWPVYAVLPDLETAALVEATSAPASLNASDDPALQQAAAQRQARQLAPAGLAPLSDQHGYQHRKLRIGYLSSGFCEHALGRMTAELFELHQRDLVEVLGFCWSPDDGSSLRARLLRSFDQHVTLAALNDQQAAQAIRAHEIDILVDLHGLGAGGRPGILAWRPAPVQIAWPGFAGTSGMDSIDYVLADAFVLPPELTPFFNEQPLYLPDSFLPGDRQRLIGARPDRAGCGLPEQAFVYCCFNPAEQLAPEQFASWMRILLRVPNSVLWLLADSEQVRDNLRVAALRHGVSSERLYFAGHALPAEALARYQSADLMLDTAPCSGGVSAADALWAGLPLLTRAGRSFAARTAGSLLHAAGLPELVAHTVDEYEALAVRLANQPKELARLRKRLARQRDSGALFDTARLARNLEQLYLRVARGALLNEQTADGQAGASAAPQRGAAGRKAGGKTASAAAALPLVSILIPADDATALAATLASALAQTYLQCEIIVSDASQDDACRRLVAPYLRSHTRLRYGRAPGLAPDANLNHCLALSLGQFIAAAPAGETLHPEKIARMMALYLQHPATGLVLSWRQPLAAAGAPLAAVPPFPDRTSVAGAALASLLLISGDYAAASMCAPGALLLRRTDLGAGFGHYMGRQYSQLAGVASALTALSGRNCVYLAEPLSSYVAPLDQGADPVRRAGHAIECLQLLYEDHNRQRLVADPERFKQVLAARLGEFGVFIADNYLVLSTQGYSKIEEIQLVLRQGYQLLLADLPDPQLPTEKS